MKISTNFSSNVLFVVLPSLLLATLIIAQEVENELVVFNNILVERVAEGLVDYWGNIIEGEWKTSTLCTEGKMQSPINLVPRRVERVPRSEKVFRHYQRGRTTLINGGHDIKLLWKRGGGSIRINGSDYILRQCHWHTPSEHMINGKRYPLEAHMVHQSQDNKIAVIGFLYDLGNPDPFLSSIQENIKSITNNSKEIMAGVIHPSEVRMGGNKYYRYMGSLTTPPCSEGVIWTIETKVGTVSKQQVNLLRDAIEDGAMENARPLQPLNGRKVHLYNTKHCLDDYLSKPYDSM